MDLLSEWVKAVINWEELADEVREKQNMINTVCAEMQLCERLGKNKETLIKEYEDRKLEW